MVSMSEYGGYAGRYLRVDLSGSKITVHKLEKELPRHYIGGVGFCARILWDEVGPATEPLGPENVLVFATGPVTGTFFPSAGRYVIAAKSPLTGSWGQASAGGHFGPELKYAGYDMAVLEGRATNPVYLHVDDDFLELRDAAHLWGRDTNETTKAIREELGDPTVKVACIGQAGEKLVRYACIISDFYRAAGRTGMGAVMGSKNLKAIAVRGSKSVSATSSMKYMDAATEAFRKVTEEWGEACESSLGRYGTPNLVEVEASIGRLPTKNHIFGVYGRADDIGSEVLNEKYRARRESCFSCGIQCKFISEVRSGPYSGTTTSGPEYETIMAFGSNCLNNNVESIIHANLLCNLYGLDTISTGKVISFAMECYEKGIITRTDADDLDLSWGNHDAIVKLVHRIATREGLGDVLAEGSRMAARKLGKGAEEFAIQVKGMEVSGQDGRAHQSSGLTHATAARGADHLTSLSCLEEKGYEETAGTRYGRERAKDLCNPLSTTYRGNLVKDLEDLFALTDSLVICKYGVMWPPIFYFDDFARAIPALTGITEYGDVGEVRLSAERICNLRKAFNAREGLTRKDDTLPERFLREPMPSGPGAGHVCQLDPMLDEYYEARGWDKGSGLPVRKTLMRVGLDSVADDLEALGRLGG